MQPHLPAPIALDVAVQHEQHPLANACSQRLPLWTLRRFADVLCCTAVTTSFGFGIALELSSELILFELESDIEELVDKASRLEASLLQRGWRAATDA